METKIRCRRRVPIAREAAHGMLRAAMRAPLLRLLLVCLPLAVGACVDEESREVAGGDLFLRYCASCHGVDAKGNGPIAGSLTTPPADLTTLARRSGGRFDEGAVMAAIDGRRLVAAHGSREMPVWGAIFEEEREGKPFQAYAGLLQSRALADYLRSIQTAE
jgi:mono/diheme cytochrome c family protein